MTAQGAGVDERSAAMRMLALDALMTRALTALAQHGVSALVIKGPVNQAWLHGGSWRRTYSDVDLLIDPADRQRARTVLASLGMRDHHAEVPVVYRPVHEEAWVGPDGAIDLHWSVVGVPAARWGAAWAALSSRAADFALLGGPVRTPDPAGRTLLVGLYAAHSVVGDNSRSDLQAALSVVPPAQWHDALTLADTLGCAAAFVSGLSLTPAGRRLLVALGRRPRLSLVSQLHDRRAPYVVTMWAERADVLGLRGLPRFASVVRRTETGRRSVRLEVLAALDSAWGLARYVIALTPRRGSRMSVLPGNDEGGQPAGPRIDA